MAGSLSGKVMCFQDCYLCTLTTRAGAGGGGRVGVSNKSLLSFVPRCLDIQTFHRTPITALLKA